MNYVGHLFDLSARFSCGKNPRHFCCKLKLDKRKPSERLPNKFYTRAESQTEMLACFFKVWPPSVLGDFFGSVGTRNNRTDKMKPAPIKMPARFEASHVVDLDLTIV